MRARLFIVDDEPSVRTMLEHAFRPLDVEVESFGGAERALEAAQERGVDVVVTDLNMPGMSGMELLEALVQLKLPVDVIMITAYGSQETAVEALRRGAFDYVTKPFQVDELRLLVGRALERRRLLRESAGLRRELAKRVVPRFGQLVGDSPAMQRVFDLLERFSRSTATVLLEGESGTGKGLAARAVHDLGSRSSGPFVSVNCGAIPENLIETELFGAVKGAYTGVDRDRPGLVRAANKGTLFLDEIGEMPHTAQVRLLQVLQDRKVRSVGATEEHEVDVRVVAATNKVLEDEVAAGRFREDLFYRLNVIRLSMPPLRERREDVLTLARYFLDELGAREGRTVTMSPGAMDALQRYPWPGNVRELSNVLERAHLLSPGNVIEPEDLALTETSTPRADAVRPSVVIPEEGVDLDAILADVERDHLQRALEMAGGNRTQAAALLGMTFRSFRYRLKKLDVDGAGDEP